MPNLNKVRLHHILYNNNNFIIRNLIFDLNGMTTLLNLENGGGKTVINQLCHAPYLNAKNRKFGNRPFSDLFATHVPSVVVHEWNMDDDAGRFIVGLAVSRQTIKSADTSRAPEDKLNVLGFIEEFPNDLTATHIQDYLFESNKAPLNYASLKAYLDSLHADKKRNFTLYSLNNSAQRKSYEDRLKSLGISFNEWEEMRKYNQEESGIAKFAETYKTEARLINDIFIPAVERRLDSNEKNGNAQISTIDIIADNIKMFATNLFEHQEDLQNYEVYQNFLAFLDQAKENQDQILKVLERQHEHENRMEGYRQALYAAVRKDEQTILETEHLQLKTEDQKRSLTAQKISSSWHELQAKFESENEKLIQASALRQTLNNQIEENERAQNIQTCAGFYKETQDYARKLAAALEEKKAVSLSSKEADERMAEYGAGLYICVQDELDQEHEAIRMLEAGKSKTENNLHQLKVQISDLLLQKSSKEKTAAVCQSRLEQYDAKEADLQRELDVEIKKQMEPYLQTRSIETLARSMKRKADAASKAAMQAAAQIELLQTRENENHSRQNQLAMHEGSLQSKLDAAKKQLSVNEANKKHRLDIAGRLYDLEEAENSLWDTDKIVNTISDQKKALQSEEQRLNQNLFETKTERENLQTGSSVKPDEPFARLAAGMQIDLVFASKWLREGGISENMAKTYIEKFPLLPYSLIMNARQKEALLKEARRQHIYTSQVLPILEREQLDLLTSGEVDYSAFESYLYANFNTDLLNPELLKIKIADLDKKVQFLNQQLSDLKKESERLENERTWMTIEAISEKQYNIDQQNYTKISEQLKKTRLEIQDLKVRNEQILKKKKEYEVLKKQNEEDEKLFRTKEEKLSGLAKSCEEARNNWLALQKLNEELEGLEDLIEEKNDLKDELENRIAALKQDLFEKNTLISSLLKDMAQYAVYKDNPIPQEGDKDYLLEQFTVYQNDPSRADLKRLDSQITEYSKAKEAASRELQIELDNSALSIDQVSDVDFSQSQLRSLKKEGKALNVKKDANEKQINSLTRTTTALSTKMENLISKLKEQTGYLEVLPADQISMVDFDAEINAQIKLLDECAREIETLKNEIKDLNHFREMIEEKILTISFENRQVPVIELDRDQVRKLSETVRNLRNQYEFILEEREKKVKELQEAIEEQRQQIDPKYEALKETARALKNEAGSPEAFMELYLRNSSMIRINLDRIQSSRDKIMAMKDESVTHIYDYIHEVYDQIGQIDKSMSINLDGDRFKMLEIQLPKIDDETKASLQKISDFVESSANDMIASGLSTDVIWKQFTTQNLFALLIPPARVRIRVQKVEQHHRYLDHWSNVAKYSGAESFLSSMTIVLAALFYQRSSSLGTITGKTKPTVLFLDNPFAYVQSDHILKHLMQMLEKTKTQMIALSKVENRDILKYIPNIYMLYLRPMADMKQHLSISEHTTALDQQNLADQMDSIHMEIEDLPAVNEDYEEDMDDQENPDIDKQSG